MKRWAMLIILLVAWFAISADCLVITELRELPYNQAKTNWRLPKELKVEVMELYQISGEGWARVAIKWDFGIAKGIEQGYIKIKEVEK